MEILDIGSRIKKLRNKDRKNSLQSEECRAMNNRRSCASVLIMQVKKNLNAFEGLSTERLRKSKKPASFLNTGRPPGRKSYNLFNLEEKIKNETVRVKRFENTNYFTRPPARQKTPPNAVNLEIPDIFSRRDTECVPFGERKGKSQILGKNNLIKPIFKKILKNGGSPEIRSVHRDASPNSFTNLVRNKYLNLKPKTFINKFKEFRLKNISDQPKSLGRIKNIVKIHRKNSEVIDF